VLHINILSFYVYRVNNGKRKQELLGKKKERKTVPFEFVVFNYFL